MNINVKQKLLTAKKRLSSKLQELHAEQSAIQESLDVYIAQSENLANDLLREANQERFFKKYIKVCSDLESRVDRLFILNVSLNELICDQLDETNTNVASGYQNCPILENKRDNSFSSSSFVIEDVDYTHPKALEAIEYRSNEGFRPTDDRVNSTPISENNIHSSDPCSSRKTPENCISPQTLLKGLETDLIFTSDSGTPSPTMCSPVPSFMENHSFPSKPMEPSASLANPALGAPLTATSRALFHPQATQLVDGVTKHRVKITKFYSVAEFYLILLSDTLQQSLCGSLNLDKLPSNHKSYDSEAWEFIEAFDKIHAVFCAVDQQAIKFIVDIYAETPEMTLELIFYFTLWDNEPAGATALPPSKGFKDNYLSAKNHENDPRKPGASDSERSNSSKEAHQSLKISFIPSSEILNQSCLEGIMAQAVSPSEFYIHLMVDSIGLLDDLQESMNNYYENINSRLRGGIKLVQPGTFWAAKPKISSDDENWYRVQVLSLDNPQDKSVKSKGKSPNFWSGSSVVQVLDYGDICQVMTDNLLPLTPEFTSHPAFAVKFSLHGVKPLDRKGWTDACINKFTELVTMTQPVEIQAVSKLGDNYYEANLFIGVEKNETSVGLALHQMGLLTCLYAVQFEDTESQNVGVNGSALTGNAKERPEIFLKQEAMTPELDKWIKATISYVCDPGHFFMVFDMDSNCDMDNAFQNAEVTDENPSALIIQNQEMNLHYNSVSSKSMSSYDFRNLPLNALLAVKSLEDGLWLRAVIEKTLDNGKTFKVFYVDFGSHEIVPKANIRLIDFAFAGLRNQAVECFLANTSPSPECGNIWTEEAKLLFEQLRANPMMKVKPVSYGVNKESIYVDLLVQYEGRCTDVAIFLVAHGYAVKHSRHLPLCVSPELEEPEAGPKGNNKAPKILFLPE